MRTFFTRTAFAVVLSLVFFLNVFLLSSRAHAEDDLLYASPGKYTVEAQARFLHGDLNRKGSGYFARIANQNGAIKVLDPAHLKFDNDDNFTGFESVFYFGKANCCRPIQFMAGGSYISSEVSSDQNLVDFQPYPGQYLIVPQAVVPANNANKTIFLYRPNNTFDMKDVKYKNSFDRLEGFIGLALASPTHAPLGMKDYGSMKDSPPVARRLQSARKFRPYGFLSLGRINVDESMFAGTDLIPQQGNKINVSGSYESKITSTFVGLGIGAELRGELTKINNMPIGYFANAKGAIEFHSVSARASSAYWQGGNVVNFNNQSQKYPNQTSSIQFSDDEIAYSLVLESGLTFGLSDKVSMDIGVRYRRTEIPQMILDGTNDAHVEFSKADEISGFIGIRANF